MKLTVNQLRRIIKEEVQKTLAEASEHYMNLYRPEGEEEFYSPEVAQKFGVQIQDTGKYEPGDGDLVKVIGGKNNILKYLTYLDSMQMSSGEGPEDWLPRIKPVRK